MNKKGKGTNERILKLLYRSFDDDLDEKERNELEEALINSEQLRQEKEKILAQRKAISESAAQSFKPFFAERVMARIDALSEKTETETFYETLRAVFKPFAIAGAVAMAALILYNLGIGDILSTEEVFFASDSAFEEILQLPLF
ncbi:MAG: hypothetical protein JSV96_14325 [Candidatus Aminicenantes bacterium]|nr:MAG: hypothetical protein JSV96_14325 [Candidatus Aminicenantes bacterium]